MNQSKIDEIVAMIDGFMSEDGGHLNVSVDDTGKVDMDSVHVDKTIWLVTFLHFLMVWIEMKKIYRR